MYDNVRKCPNCHSDAPCMGALRKCNGIYENNIIRLILEY